MYPDGKGGLEVAGLSSSPGLLYGHLPAFAAIDGLPALEASLGSHPDGDPAGTQGRRLADADGHTGKHAGGIRETWKWDVYSQWWVLMLIGLSTDDLNIDISRSGESRRSMVTDLRDSPR